MDNIISIGRFRVEIEQDENCDSPRDSQCNLGTIACCHRRYAIGDKHSYSVEQLVGAEATGTLDGERIICLPVYGYDHGGMTIRTEAFSCPWDSGQLGIVFVTESRVRKEYGWKRINNARREKILNTLRAEVAELDSWLTGDTWQYTAWENGCIVDQCGGFIGRECVESHIRSEFRDEMVELLNKAKESLR